jgi:hypothetical protein
VCLASWRGSSPVSRQTDRQQFELKDGHRAPRRSLGFARMSLPPCWPVTNFLANTASGRFSSLEHLPIDVPTSMGRGIHARLRRSSENSFFSGTSQTSDSTQPDASKLRCASSQPFEFCYRANIPVQAGLQDDAPPTGGSRCQNQEIIIPTGESKMFQFL